MEIGWMIENLQKISQKYNVIKDRKGQERIECICPVCGQTFLFPKRTFPHIQILAVAEGVVELNLIGKYKYNLVTWQNELCTSPPKKAYANLNPTVITSKNDSLAQLL